MPSSFTWQPGPSGGTPMTADNLNKLAVVADIPTAGTPTGDALRAAFDARYFAARLLRAYEAVPCYSFGDSYGSANGGAAGDIVNAFPYRIAGRLRTQNIVDKSVSGTRSDQILGQVQTFWPIGGRGLVILSDLIINDTKQYGDLTGISTATEATRTMLAYLNAQAVSSPTGSAFQYGPGWSSATTSSVGSYVDVAWTGDTCYLLANYVTGTSGTATVKNPAGSTVATISTGGYKQNFTGAVKLSGWGAGSHTARIALTAGTLTLAGVAVPSPSPPRVLWYQATQINQGTTLNGQLAAYVSGVAAVLPDFPTVITIAPDAGFSLATMFVADNIHLNDYGNSYVADLACAALLSGPFVQGVNTMTATSLPYSTPSPAYVGPGATAPAAPTGVTATASSQADVTWTRAADGGATITAQPIQASSDSGATWATVATAGATATTMRVGTGLTQGTSYVFRVGATNAVGTTYSTASASVTAGAPLTTYAADTFTRADSTTLGSTETGGFAWATINTGFWSIAGGTISSTGAGSATAPNDVYVDDGHFGGTYQATLVEAGTGSRGMVFGCGVGDTTGYLVWPGASGTQYTLSKRSAAGAYTTLGTSAGAAPVAGDVIAVVVNGTSMIVKINGTQVISVTESTYSGTRCGFWSTTGSTIHFDNFTHTNATT